MSDFLKPIEGDKQGKFELERVIKYFTQKVREAEKDPWAAKADKVKEAEVVKTKKK